MTQVGEMLDRKERPAYVKFIREAVEDKAASQSAGHYVARDVDYACVTPPYSKDVFKQKVDVWFSDLKQQVANGRMPQDWLEQYQEAYRRWQNGQEIPLKGTPIRGWGVISPAQQETLIRLNILTVEDLRDINDEGVRYIGMGAIELKNKAAAWLSQLEDKGPLTQEIASLKSENNLLKANLEHLGSQMEELKKALERQDMAQGNAQAQSLPAASPSSSISSRDILDDTPPVLVDRPEASVEKPEQASPDNEPVATPAPKKKRGRPRKNASGEI